MLLERGADVSATNALGETPLTVMCKSNQLKLDAKVENFLIEKSSEAGALDHQDTVFGNNALHYAANLRRTRLVTRLCKRGANVDIPLRASGGNRTPIFSAFRGAADSFLSGAASQSQMHWLAVDGLLNYNANILEFFFIPSILFHTRTQ